MLDGRWPYIPGVAVRQSVAPHLRPSAAALSEPLAGNRFRTGPRRTSRTHEHRTSAFAQAAGGDRRVAGRDLNGRRKGSDDNLQAVADGHPSGNRLAGVSEFRRGRTNPHRSHTIKRLAWAIGRLMAEYFDAEIDAEAAAELVLDSGGPQVTTFPDAVTAGPGSPPNQAVDSQACSHSRIEVSSIVVDAAGANAPEHSRGDLVPMIAVTLGDGRIDGAVVHETRGEMDGGRTSAPAFRRGRSARFARPSTGRPSAIRGRGPTSPWPRSRRECG